MVNIKKVGWSRIGYLSQTTIDATPIARIRITQKSGMRPAIARAAPVRLFPPVPVMFVTCSVIVGVSASPMSMNRNVMRIPERSFFSDIDCQDLRDQISI